ncbi:hypothetical protein [Bradyrhizobium guangdongense]|uniref:Lipoprotein n=1 Tax=Bradyrhizobium guangdongense TaxID=1325090 RepID=A0AA88B5Q7_9BRAD|nr:hypothetical protein [Bradyrhizobium guangdongense]GGI18793.1 hypothetical protein GCM10010987_01080 [Bradyrhizobium guangdongense]
MKPLCKTAVLAQLVAASLYLGACSPQEDAHLTCAATIFVADKLMETGKVPTDPALRQKANDAEINHQNASATFRRLDTREPEGKRERLMELAFIFGKERDRILNELSPKEIVARAKTCVEQAPPKGRGFPRPDGSF